jgi:hypothetical protein
MKNVLLRLYYWLVYILSFVFEVLSGVFVALEWVIVKIKKLLYIVDIKLLNHLIKVGNKLDGKVEGENK